MYENMYANPCKLTICLMGFLWVLEFMCEKWPNKYFCSRKWRIVTHIIEKCRKLYCIAET